MKIISAISAVIITGVPVLGFLFVRWANQPKNAAARLKKLQREAAFRSGRTGNNK